MAMWRLLLLAALPALVGVGGEAPAPRFLPARRAVAAAPGGRAELECRVARLGDATVSWVRGRDLQILTHAGEVFSADPRVDVAVSGAGGGGWAGGAGGAGGPAGVTHALRLHRLRASDAGRYECQLNTEPKLSLTFELVVTDEPQPRLVVSALTPATIRAAAGGASTLGCEARLLHAPARAVPLKVAWFHGGEPLEAHSGRAGYGGVSLESERRADGATARLTLAALGADDAGPYTCRVGADDGSLTGEATVNLLVEDSEAGEMEAMQRDQWPGAGGAAPTPALAPALTPAAALLALLAAARAHV